MVLVLLCKGFEEAEVAIPVDLLRRGGVEVALCGVETSEVVSAHAITFGTDVMLCDVDLDKVDMVFVPGGLGGVDGILSSPAACDCLKKAKEQGKYLSAICAGPTVLSRLGLIDGCKATCYPGMEDLLVPALPQLGAKAVYDENGKVLTGQAAGAGFDLGLMMLTVLKDAATAEQVRKAVHYND